MMGITVQVLTILFGGEVYNGLPFGVSGLLAHLYGVFLPMVALSTTNWVVLERRIVSNEVQATAHVLGMRATGVTRTLNIIIF